MRRLAILLALLAMAGVAAGCTTPTYRMQVNGYTDPAQAEQIAPGGTFFVIENKEAQNPLLEKEIKGKIDKLLEQRGYRLVPFEKADYYLLFSYGMGAGRNVAVVMPDYYPYDWGWGPGFGVGIGGGSSYFFAAPFFSFSPSYVETLYDRFLLLSVVDGKYYRANQGKFRTLWVGEARSTGPSSDFRTVVNYLLAGLFEQFGQNTGKALPIEINQEDLRIKSLGP